MKSKLLLFLPIAIYGHGYAMDSSEYPQMKVSKSHEPSQEINNAREKAFEIFMATNSPEKMTSKEFWLQKKRKLAELSKSIDKGSSDLVIETLTFYAEIVPENKGCICKGMCMHAEHDIPPHKLLPIWIAIREDAQDLKEFLKNHGADNTALENYRQWLRPRRRGVVQ